MNLFFKVGVFFRMLKTCHYFLHEFIIDNINNLTITNNVAVELTSLDQVCVSNDHKNSESCDCDRWMPYQVLILANINYFEKLFFPKFQTKSIYE